MENLANSLSLKEIKWEERPSRRESLAQIKQLKQDVQRVLQLNYKFAMDAAHAVMLLDPRRVHDDLLSDEPQHRPIPPHASSISMPPTNVSKRRRTTSKPCAIWKRTSKTNHPTHYTSAASLLIE